MIDELTPEELERLAKLYHIPKKHCQREPIRNFLWFAITVRGLQAKMTMPFPSDITPSDEELIDKFKPSLRQRYHDAEVLLRCVIEILEQGLKGREVSAEYLQGKANAALSFYGLKVVRNKKE